jgi:hypothetical protein
MSKKRPLDRLWSGIETGSKAAWIPILIVASCSLYYTCQNYSIQASADRPIVRATGADLTVTPDPETYTFAVSLLNKGRKDATELKLKVGTIDPTTKATKLLAAEPLTRLRASLQAASVELFKIQKRDFLKVLLTCISYSDDSGNNNFEPDVAFFDLNWAPHATSYTLSQPTAAQQDAVLSWFSCAKM